MSCDITAPVIRGEVLESTTYSWQLDSSGVQFVDGTNLDGLSITAGPVPIAQYNSVFPADDVQQDPIVVSPQSAKTKVRLGLNSTGHVRVTLRLYVVWTFRPESGGDNTQVNIPVSADVAVDFYAVQVSLMAAPRAIAAQATGAVPICFRIAGPGENKGLTEARITDITVHFSTYVSDPSRHD